MDTIDLVNAALVGDSGAFKNAFDAAISARVNDALEVKKVEIASSLLTPEVQTNEIEGLEKNLLKNDKELHKITYNLPKNKGRQLVLSPLFILGVKT